MNVFEELKATAEKHNVELQELCVNPEMQMRVEMDQETIEAYAENIETILEESPIEIVIVESATQETFYVVDGFHRYFAALNKNIEVVPVEAYRGTYEQALQYAMSANFKNGLRPNKDDSAKCIKKLLETAPDFGYDSKKVAKFLNSFGIPNSTSNPHTKDFRKSIDERREIKIIDLHQEGKSQREIATEVGAGVATVNRTIESISVPNQRNVSLEHPASLTESEDNSPFFDDEETEELDIVNPADAFNKALQEQSSEAEDATVTPNDPTSGNVELVAYLKSALSLAMDSTEPRLLAIAPQLKALIEGLDHA